MRNKSIFNKRGKLKNSQHDYAGQKPKKHPGIIPPLAPVATHPYTPMRVDTGFPATMLFEKITEPVRALLGEGGRWELALRLKSGPASVYSVFLDCRPNVTGRLMLLSMCLLSHNPFTVTFTKYVN